MAKLLDLQTKSDSRGSLTVIDDIAAALPFSVKRVFYIYDVDSSVRGGHRHKETYQAAICLNGSCVVCNDDGEVESEFVLDAPSKCLILEPKDWHQMKSFSTGAVFLVFASESYDPDDYIFEPYR